MYWTYPTLPSFGTDPNQVAGADGPGPTAIMPTSFNMSSAVVETIGGVPYLYIGSQNGRVYAINMEGRGDGTMTQPGTTSRLWSFPNDYPATAVTSSLGPISGSLAFVNDGVMAASVIVPTSQEAELRFGRSGHARDSYDDHALGVPGTDLRRPALALGRVQRPGGEPLWANPGNASAQDNIYATAAPDNGTGGSGFSQLLEGVAPVPCPAFPRTQ